MLVFRKLNAYKNSTDKKSKKVILSYVKKLLNFEF